MDILLILRFVPLCKADPSGIQTNNSVLTVHSLQPLSYLHDQRDVVNSLQDHVATNLMSKLGDRSGQVRIILAVNFPYTLYFHPSLDLIQG